MEMNKKHKKYAAKEAVELLFALPSDPEDLDKDTEDETDEEFSIEKTADLSDPQPSTSRGLNKAIKKADVKQKFDSLSRMIEVQRDSSDTEQYNVNDEDNEGLI